MKMLRQKKGKWVLACVAVLVMLMPVLAACPPPVPEVPTIRIGVIGPMKFLAGEHMWWGAKLAAEEINAAGGVNVGGVMHEIELIKADDNSVLSIPDAVGAMERIITVDRVHFVIGGFRSEAVLAQQEVMADHGVIYLGIGSAHPEQNMRLAKDFDRYKYWFRTAPLNAHYMGRVIFEQIHMVAEEVREVLGIETPRVAIKATKVVAWDPIVEAAKKSLPKMGMEVVGVWRPSSVAVDVTAELTGIKKAGAHIIFHLNEGPAGTVFSRQWGELQIPAAPVGINVQAQSKGHWAATGGVTEYEMLLNFYAVGIEITPKSRPFFDKFVERFGEYPTYTASTYDAIFILAEAIERAGTIETYPVLAELQKTEYPGTGGLITYYPPDHPRWPHDLRWGPGYVGSLGVQWRDGKLVAVWPDGQPGLEGIWEGIRYEGTVDYKLPPWMVEYWRGRT
jgi:branched-chain amino acid transport system substrate-binding protein